MMMHSSMQRQITIPDVAVPSNVVALSNVVAPSIPHVHLGGFTISDTPPVLDNEQCDEGEGHSEE